MHSKLNERYFLNKVICVCRSIRNWLNSMPEVKNYSMDIFDFPDKSSL